MDKKSICPLPILAGKRETDAFGVWTAFLLVLFLNMRMMKVVYFLEKFLKTAAPENTLLKSEYDVIHPLIFTPNY